MQSYSIGIHPWDTAAPVSPRTMEVLEEAVRRPQVMAIGECGIDLAGKGGPLFGQLNVLKQQISLSEDTGKPMILHDVKAHDIFIALRRDLKPRQNWAIHGFRGKPQVAEMLLKAGFWLSFGQNFNPEAVAVTPDDLILAETDEAPVGIEEVITRISAAKGRDMHDIIRENTRRFLKRI